MSNSLKTEVGQLKSQLQAFIMFFEQEYDYTTMVYELWNAKDVLGHITFWHESFARNISDLGKGKKPNPLKGKLSQVNQLSVETTRQQSIDELIARLHKAQKTIEKHIFNAEIELIPYKKGSRSYSRIEHVIIVENHIRKHLTHLQKSIGNA